jgi:predicted helicase
MSPFQRILLAYHNASKTEREKGTYFEELIRTYFRYEATYADHRDSSPCPFSDAWKIRVHPYYCPPKTCFPDKFYFATN